MPNYRYITLAAILLSPLLRAESPLKIESALYAVEYDTSAAEFSIIHKPSGKTFARNGKLENGGGKAAIIPVKDKTFGEGQAISACAASRARAKASSTCARSS